MPLVMESGKIESDLPCRKCGYNLRGLPIDHLCPECGESTLDTIAQASGDAVPEGDEVRHQLRARRYLPIAQAAGCSVDAVMFVADAAAGARWLASAPRGAQITARQICGSIRAHAMWYFNDKAEAMELLAEWGIRRSEDAGRIIFAMVEKGLLKAGNEDSIDQFNGLFTLDSLFDSGEASMH